jgi:hypothetical protein
MRTRRKKRGEIKISVVCVIEQEEPIIAFPGKPPQGVVCGFANLLRESNILQVGINGLSCGGVDEEDIREADWIGIFSLNVP